MEMHQVRYFLAVSRTLNFTRAAEECNVSQPSLTKAIQKLEEELGGLLFRRERGLTHLTDLGRLMLPHLEQTYSASQAARSLAQGLKRADLAPLRVGIADSIYLRDLTELLRELGRALKGLQLTVCHAGQDAVVEAALKGDVDIVVVTAREDLPDRLRLRDLAQERPVLLCPPGHRLANQSGAALAELDGEPWIERTGCPAASRFLDTCRLREVQPVTQHRACSDYAVQQMVLGGMGCALSWEGSPRLPTLGALVIGEPDLSRTMALGTVAGRQFSQATDTFLRLARCRDWTHRGEPVPA